MGRTKIVSLRAASEEEARERINSVLGPYLDNLHHIHEASTLSLLRDIEEQLETAFMGFGFEYHDIYDDGEDNG